MSRVMTFGLVGIIASCVGAGCDIFVDVPLGVPPAPVVDRAGRVPLYVCEANAMVEEPLQRLTALQLSNTTVVALTTLVGSARAAELATFVENHPSALPSDVAPPDPRNRFRALYRRFDREVGALHVVSWHDQALLLAERLVAEDRDALLGECASATSGSEVDACLQVFVDRVGPVLLRAPLSAEERAQYVAILGDTTVFDDAALRDVLGTMLAAPGHVYQLAFGEDAEAPETYPLTSLERANRLSYVLWDAPPDDALLADAARGWNSDDEWGATVDRMLNDPRADQAVLRFFADWMRLDLVPDFSAQLNVPAYRAFVGELAPTSLLQQDARAEMLAMVEHLLLREQQPVSSLLTSSLVFPRTDELAAIYGLPAPYVDGEAPPQALDAPRPGILTRVAMLGSGQVRTRPIHKGALVFDQLLCAEFPPPPPGAGMSVVTLPPPYSTRDYVEALTEDPAQSCIGCHASINPYGYATERFDALGRSRTIERAFDDDGNEIGQLALNTTGEVQTPSGAVRFDDVAGLVDAIAPTGIFEACLSRHLFRHLSSRMEDQGVDGCVLQAMQLAAEQGNVRDVMRAYVMHPSFGLRRIVGVEP
jgi:hypothetical protein